MFRGVATALVALAAFDLYVLDGRSHRRQPSAFYAGQRWSAHALQQTII